MTTPSDVLKYRAAWDDYVMQTACALAAQAWAATQAANNGGAAPTSLDGAPPCSQAWAGNVNGALLDTSQFAMQPPSAQLLNAFAEASQQLSDNLVSEWDIYAGWTDQQITLSAGDILQSYQKTVLEVAQKLRAGLVQFSPGMANAIAAGADENVQKQIIAQIEGDQILANGVLGVISTGVGGMFSSISQIPEFATDKLLPAIEKVGIVAIVAGILFAIAKR